MGGLAGSAKVTCCYPDIAYVEVEGKLSKLSDYITKHHFEWFLDDFINHEIIYI